MLTKPTIALLGAAVALLAANSTLNYPTGKQGLLLIDKVGAHIRFFDPATYHEISNFEVRSIHTIS